MSPADFRSTTQRTPTGCWNPARAAKCLCCPIAELKRGGIAAAERTALTIAGRTHSASYGYGGIGVRSRPGGGRRLLRGVPYRKHLYRGGYLAAVARECA